ncbi:hypothetical protein SUGI_0475140 [Cryptomeria japonica]|nr:hypothetical protein SUGI_0475140 [Cryptomeria japonica]
MADQDANNVQDILDLANPNWGDPNTRRRIAACLVNVVYQIEKGNGKKEMVKKKEEVVKEWCSLLKFKVKETIKDETIFGAIFQWDGTSEGGEGEGKPPSEVVAFRGTILKGNYILGKDFRHNWKAVNARHKSISRVDKGLEQLKKSIQRNKPHKIWIVGHSLGAAIAIAVARKMGKEERNKMEAHLFNPPFFSPRLPEIKFFEMVGRTLSAVRDGPTSLHLPLLEGVYKKIKGACKGVAVSSGLKDDIILLGPYGDFIAVSSWVPNIYVNRNDLICNSYIRYFEVLQGIYKEESQDLDKPLHERMKFLFCYEVAKKRTPWHLLPSATLFVRETSDHNLSQWWSGSLELEGDKYIPPTDVTHCKPTTENQCNPSN